jgi:hypothetical protein
LRRGAERRCGSTRYVQGGETAAVPRHQPVPGELVFHPPVAVRRRSEARMVGLFIAMGIPVAVVVGLVIGWPVAGAYLVAQTAFLTYGLRRRHVPVLRLSPDGISFEPGPFQIRCAWDDVDGVEQVLLPDGRVDAWRLSAPRVHWADTPARRSELAKKGWDTLVPVGQFDPDWRGGPIGDAVRGWRPQLVS